MELRDRRRIERWRMGAGDGDGNGCGEFVGGWWLLLSLVMI